jgi:uncharacterized protein
MTQALRGGAYFPGRALIDAYGNGGFRFAEMSHRGSLLILPSGIYGWAAADFSELSVASFAPVFAERQEIALVLLGTGTAQTWPDQAVRQAFADNDLVLSAWTPEPRSGLIMSSWPNRATSRPR